MTNLQYQAPMTTLKMSVGYPIWIRLIGRLCLILGFSVLLRAEQPLTNTAQMADRVVVIRNMNSPVSRAVADDYVRRRLLNHTLTVACPDSAVDTAAETIRFKAFQETVEAPLRAFLVDHPSIDFIVLTKGIPIRLADAPQGRAPGPLALDSYLASLQYEKLPDAVRVDVSDPSYGGAFHGMAWANRFWNSRERFSHARFGGYLVTRLDGYTEADAKALSARSVAAEKAMDSGTAPRPKILLDVSPGYGFDEKSKVPHSILSVPATTAIKIIQESKFSEFNSDMQWAAKLLSARRIPVELETSDRFVGNVGELAGYVSWGSNDQHFEPAAYRSLRFTAGALCETAVSTSARTFLPTKGGQSLIADLIGQGATGAKGYTDEPLLQAVASPSILFERYTRGWTLAESYYAASRLVGWQDVVVGDPLCRSYAEGRFYQ
jgi:uncharacterized protein (TIGR03790 family)